MVPFIWNSRRGKSTVVQNGSVVARGQRAGGGNACKGARENVSGVLEYSVVIRWWLRNCVHLSKLFELHIN